MGELERRKRRRDRSRSRSRSQSRSPSRSRSESRRRGRTSSSHRSNRDRKKSRRHRSASRSRSASPSRSSSPSDRRGRSSRADKKTRDDRSDKRSKRDRSDRRRRSRSESRHSKRDKDRKKRRQRHSRSMSRSESPGDRQRDEKKATVAPSAVTAAVPSEVGKQSEPVDKRAETSLGSNATATNAKHRSRSRSPRDRKHSRSRSRGREKKPSTTEATKAAASTSSATSGTKKFNFGSISLKPTDKKTGTLKSPTAKTLAAGIPVSAEEEKKRRREKAKLWREQQLKNGKETKEKMVKEFLEEPDAMPKTIGLWSLEDESGKKETVEEAEQRHQREEEQRQRVQQVVEEVDPLDAYMAGLVDEAAIEQSRADPSSNVISLNQIQGESKVNIYGTFLPPRNAPVTPIQQPAAPPDETEEEREAREERELQEFMRAIKEKREQEQASTEVANGAEGSGTATQGPSDSAGSKKDHTGRIFQGFEEDIIGEEAESIDQRSALEILQEAQKKKEIKPVDHSQIEYLPFQKKFYVVPKEIKDMTEEQVQEIRNELEIKIRGKNCPRPLEKWTQCGFSLRLLQLIQKHGYAAPFAIQRQALPAIMSGRDVIGIAKTGSGKTLAFLLPMFRHILHQPPLKEAEGPIGLIMAPARELAQQIYLEAKKFAKDLGMRATAVYGGSSVSEQIANLKRGSDVVICTPGRMIDILCMSAGKMVSLKRVTYVVLDEADRMFDMGFEPQITKIMLNIRSDRQTLLFSATFPRAVEALARKVLKRPVEITVGARSTASGDITQYVEVREENDKFMRLLQLLGLWYEKGNILVFVNTQQACDQIFQDLMKAGYPALSLHGGKDQVDRDYTIDDFKRKVRTLMVATSVAGRGLDVKDLVLVINYHCPNHLEDYVHRVGRTGRAGRKGTAYTFISDEEEEYSVDLVKALESAKQTVPPELTALAEGFKAKVKRGEARYHGSGFSGSGYTFDASERNETQRVADMQRRQYELDQGIVVEDAVDDDDADEVAEPTTQEKTAPPDVVVAPKPGLDTEALSAVKKAQQIAQILDMQYKQTQATVAAATEGHFIEELAINDYPQQARWKVTQKEASESVAELTGAAVIARGSYVPAGRKPNPGERKLYLAIEGPTRQAVVEAKRELQRILDETTLQVGLGGDKYGKYNL